MITIQRLKMDSIDLSSEPLQQKTLENKSETKSFKDIINYIIASNSSEKLHTANNSNEDFSFSNIINNVQIENKDSMSNDNLENLLSLVLEKLQGVIENKISIKEFQLKNLEGAFTNLIEGFKGEELEENSELSTEISNIIKELRNINSIQLKQIPLENLNSLKELLPTTLSKVNSEPVEPANSSSNSISAVLSPVIERLKNLLTSKTSNENSDIKVSLNKRKELKELEYLLNKLVRKQGNKSEESLKGNSQADIKISKSIKELEKLISIQLEQIPLEDLNLLKDFTKKLLDTDFTNPNNVLATLSTITEKLQNIAVSTTTEDSKNIGLLPAGNEVNFKNKLSGTFASDKNQDMKEISTTLTQLVADIKDQNLLESLKENPKVFREMLNIAQEISKIEPKQVEQLSLDDLNVLQQIAKSVLNELKESNPKNILKEKFAIINTDINVNNSILNKGAAYLKEDLSNSKEDLSNNSKEDLILKKIIDGSDTRNDNILIFTQRFSGLKNAEQIKGDFVINKHSIINDVVKTVKYMVQNNERTLTVKMNPKDLGEITIKIVSQGDSMKAIITTGSKDTLSLLRANEMDMKKIFDIQGIKISEVNISLYNDDTTFFREQAGSDRQNHDQGHQGQKHSQNKAGFDEDIYDEKVTEILNNTSNINMFA